MKPTSRPLPLRRALPLLWLALLITLANCAAGRALPTEAARSTLNADSLVRVRLNQTKPGNQIPARFVGLSYEASQLGGPYFSPENSVLSQLLRNLGDGTLRFGGNDVDRAVWSPAGLGPLAKGSSALLPEDLDRMFAFANHTEWKVILGLNLGANEPGIAADQAAYAAAVANGALLAIEIGNEPNLYTRIPRNRPPLRSTDWGYGDYLDEFRAYRQAISQRTDNVPLAGPSTAGSEWLAGFLEDEAAQLSYASVHHYPLARPSNETGDHATRMITTLLSRETIKRSRDALNPAVRSARQYGLPLLLDETNSASGGGVAGMSDTFAAALWAIDYLFTTAELGVSGLNFHGRLDRCGGYTPICARNADQALAGNYRAQPLYYGLLFFRTAAQGRLIPATVDGERNLAAYATSDESGRLRVALINKERSRALTVRVDLGQRYRQAGLLRLVAPSLNATDGVSFGGEGVDADGQWRGVATPLSITGRVLTVAVPPGSAALVVLDE